MLQKIRRILRNRKGQGMVEYGILIGGVTLICLVAVAVLGPKTNDLIASVASVLPGAHADDNGPIISAKLVETAADATTGNISLDTTAILAGNNTSRLSANLGVDITTLVVEP